MSARSTPVPAKVRRSARLALAFAALVPSMPDASAQGMRFGPGIAYNEPDLLVPLRSVVFRLHERGFTEIARPRFDGTAYIVDATDPAGLRTRLFVDARDGVLLGRRRLEIPYYPTARLRRAPPGFGWTEDEDRWERTARVPDALIPPGTIPGDGPAVSRARRGGPEADVAARSSGSEPNPLGLNPDARARAGAAPRRSAKLSPPPAKAAPPTTPAPAAGESQTVPAPAAGTVTSAPPVERPPVEAVTPATNRPVPAARPGGETRAAAGPAKDLVQDLVKDQAWQDPPADAAKRKVRVIDGATIVPGSGESAAPEAN